MFCTVLNSLKSPANVGTIVRSHVAFGGREMVFVGHERPWEFKKSTEAFSRKLERQCKLVFIECEANYFDWAAARGYASVAIEICEESVRVQDFSFPDCCALIFGNEARGLSGEFLSSCDFVVRIPQPGAVGSLNVAAAAAIAMHELNRCATERPIVGHKFHGEQNRGKP